MSARNLLDQLLQSGKNLLNEGASRTGASGGAGGLLSGLGGNLGKLTGGQGGGGLGGMLGSVGGALGNMGGVGKGALGAGALGLLLSSKQARKIGGSVALYGGMAALGALAYKAYGDWQKQQTAPGAAPAEAPRTLDRLPAPEAEVHSKAVLMAMIGAAKADGHIDANEQEAIRGELAKVTDNAEDRAWLEAEISRPLDPAAIARAASTPEMAAEMYLASLLVVDEEAFMERAYLDELARQLKLDPGLKQQLEQNLKANAQPV